METTLRRHTSTFLAAVTSAVVLLTGCTDHRVVGERKVERITGLHAEVKNDKALANVHVVSLAPLQFSDEAATHVGKRKDLQDELYQALRTEMGLEVQREEDRSDKVPDATLHVTINQLQERVGSRVGASQPARVDFLMRLVKSTSGDELWRATYHFEDQAVVDNLLRLNRTLEGGGGPGWKSTRELLQTAFRAAGRDISERRLALFVAPR